MESRRNCSQIFPLREGWAGKPAPNGKMFSCPLPPCWVSNTGDISILRLWTEFLEAHETIHPSRGGNWNFEKGGGGGRRHKKESWGYCQVTSSMSDLIILRNCSRCSPILLKTTKKKLPVLSSVPFQVLFSLLLTAWSPACVSLKPLHWRKKMHFKMH